MVILRDILKDCTFMAHQGNNCEKKKAKSPLVSHPDITITPGLDGTLAAAL